MQKCFVPLVILAILIFSKLVLFNVSNPKLTAVEALSLLAIPFCIETYFDANVY